MARFSFNDSGRMRFSIITERFLTSVLKILGSDTEIPKRSINNLIKLFNSLDLRYYYERDVTVGTLIKVIEMIIGSRLINRNRADVDSYILEIESLFYNENNGECISNLIIPMLLTAKCNTFPHDLEIMNAGLDIQLKYGKILMMADDLTQCFNNMRTTTGSDLEETLGTLRSLFSTALEYFRETDNQLGMNNIVHTHDPDFTDTMIDTYQKITNPSNVLRTGLQLYNKMLSTRGGFESGKFYMIYAKINSFKSALLEQIVRMIQQFNSGIFLEEYQRTGRRPTILFISLENSLYEDNERLFKMYTGFDIESRRNIDDMRDTWIQHYGKTDSIIDISMYHGESNTVRPADIRNMIDTLNDEGYKVIACVLDYFELLRVDEDYARLEPRMQHTKNSEGMLNIAKIYDIPVISAHQLNRVGDATLMNARDAGGMNVVQNMNNQYIGESFGIEKAVSHSVFVNIEKNPFDAKNYLTVKLNKNRGKKSEVDYFVHEVINGIYLEDDVDLPEPLSKTAILASESDIDYHVINDKNNGKRGVKDPVKGNGVTELKAVTTASLGNKVAAAADILEATLSLMNNNPFVSMFGKFDNRGYAIVNRTNEPYSIERNGLLYTKSEYESIYKK